jgi:hypothetical protein
LKKINRRATKNPIKAPINLVLIFIVIPFEFYFAPFFAFGFRHEVLLRTLDASSVKVDPPYSQTRLVVDLLTQNLLHPLAQLPDIGLGSDLGINLYVDPVGRL